MATSTQTKKKPTTGKTTSKTPSKSSSSQTKSKSKSQTSKTGSQSSKPKTQSSKPKQSTPTKEPMDTQSKNQITCVVMFLSGILITALLIFKGENVWLFLHNVLWGLFGKMAVLLPIALFYISIRGSIEQINIKIKSIQSSVLVIFLCSGINILWQNSLSEFSFWEAVKESFSLGCELKGGGFFGNLLGYPMIKLFGVSGATVIILLATLAFVLFVTGATLIDLFKTFSRPAHSIGEQYAKKRERREEKARYDIDVEIDDDDDDDYYYEQKPKLKGKKKQSETVPENKAEKIFELDKGKSTKPDLETSTNEFLDMLNKNKAKNQTQNNPEKTPTSEEKKQLDLLLARASQNGQNPDENKDEKPQDKSKEKPESVSKIAEDFTAKIDDIVKEQSQAEIVEYKYPPLSLLKHNFKNENHDVAGELKQNAELLVNTLKSFGVQTRVVDISRGPTVTRYELQPSAGVKISKITGLADDLALNLAASGVRIEAPIPNKAAVGIEVPNKIKEMVSMRETIESDAFSSAKTKLSVGLGKDISGNDIICDIGKMPHLLIAGATGSGKSVCVNTMLISILYRSSPEDVKVILIDPKMVEFSKYAGIPHLLVPVVTDPRKAAGALGWAVTEMLHRYKVFSENGVRDLESYNKFAKTQEDIKTMPQVVIVIDELADLMMAAPNEVEDAICRLAQMARAAGMHLIIATQRPSVNVITGVIKANIPSRIALSVSSQIDSRTIIDTAGAEKLLGYGDMLYSPMGVAKPIRLQGGYVSQEEVEAVCSFIKDSSKEIEYDEKVIQEIEKQAVQEKQDTQKGGNSGGGFDDTDPAFNDAIAIIVEAGQASTSFLQRKLKLGYARAARLMDDLESKGIVGPADGSKPRPVLITRNQWIEMNLAQSTKEENQQ